MPNQPHPIFRTRGEAIYRNFLTLERLLHTDLSEETFCSELRDIHGLFLTWSRDVDLYHSENPVPNGLFRIQTLPDEQVEIAKRLLVELLTVTGVAKYTLEFMVERRGRRVGPGAGGNGNGGRMRETGRQTVDEQIGRVRRGVRALRAFGSEVRRGERGGSDAEASGSSGESGREAVSEDTARTEESEGEAVSDDTARTEESEGETVIKSEGLSDQETVIKSEGAESGRENGGEEAAGGTDCDQETVIKSEGAESG